MSMDLHLWRITQDMIGFARMPLSPPSPGTMTISIMGAYAKLTSAPFNIVMRWNGHVDALCSTSGRFDLKWIYSQADSDCIISDPVTIITLNLNRVSLCCYLFDIMWPFFLMKLSSKE